MINEFMPDVKIGTVGAWSKDTLDLIHPTMIVFDATDHAESLWSTDPDDLPVIAVHKIYSMRDTYTKTNKVNARYFKGYKFLSHGIMNGVRVSRTCYLNAYMMFVYVVKRD